MAYTTSDPTRIHFPKCKKPTPQFPAQFALCAAHQFYIRTHNFAAKNFHSRRRIVLARSLHTQFSSLISPSISSRKFTTADVHNVNHEIRGRETNTASPILRAAELPWQQSRARLYDFTSGDGERVEEKMTTFVRSTLQNCRL